MRRSIVLVLLIGFLTSTGMSAQTNDFTAETFLGVNGGSTLSMVNFLPAVNQSFLMGYHGGIVFRHNTQNHMGLQAELNYMQRGWNETDGYSRITNYVELPFMSHFYFGKKLQFFFNVGPKISFLLNDEVLSADSSQGLKEQYSPINRPFDYGFCGGFGVQLKTRKHVFLLDSRINFSISNLFPDRMNDYFTTSNHMNASVSAAWLIKTN